MTPTRGTRCHFFVCTNTRPEGATLPSCGRRGSASVAAAFGRELRRRGFPPGVKVTTTSCLTPCQFGPTVAVYPQDIWYGGVTPDDVAEIIAAHLDENAHVPRLLLPAEAQLW